MDSKISITEESLNELTKAVNQLTENIGFSVNSVKKAFELAEMEGWNDRKFIQIREDFNQAERLIKEGTSYVDDIIVPELRRLKMILEGY